MRPIARSIKPFSSRQRALLLYLTLGTILITAIFGWFARDSKYSILCKDQKPFIDQAEMLEDQAREFYELTEPKDLFACQDQNLQKDLEKNKEICVGITSVPRPKKQYLNMTVFSLFNQSSVRERCLVDMTVFNTAVNWREYSLANEMSKYVSVVAMGEVELERKRRSFSELTWHFNETLGYIFALRHCMKKDYEYALILEDDVLATKSWVSKTLDAAKYADKTYPDWFLMKLFYTNHYAGWEDTDTPTLLAIGTIVGMIVFLIVTMVWKREEQGHGRILFQSIVSVWIALFTVWLIYIVSKQNFWWVYINWKSPYVMQHDEASATVAHLYKSDGLAAMVDYLEKHITDGPVDVLIGRYHRENSKNWYAKTLPAFQHFGCYSSNAGKIQGDYFHCKMHTKFKLE